MSEPEYVLVKHMGHDGPWLLPKTHAEVRQRISYIEQNKPEAERPTRLKLLGIVKEPLPPQLQKAHAVWQKAYAARQKSYADWQKAYAARQKADVAWEKADAAWQKAIVSKAGVAFHAQVCGCGWTPEQPDILKLIAQQKE